MYQNTMLKLYFYFLQIFLKIDGFVKSDKDTRIEENQNKQSF